MEASKFELILILLGVFLISFFMFSFMNTHDEDIIKELHEIKVILQSRGIK
jgi:hypothetical protein